MNAWGNLDHVLKLRFIKDLFSFTCRFGRRKDFDDLNFQALFEFLYENPCDVLKDFHDWSGRKAVSKQP